MPTALLDGDIIAYRASAVLTEDPWDTDGPKVPLSEQEAIRVAKLLAITWMELAGCDKSIICLTGKNNFRKRILPSYKENRKGTLPPASLKAVKAALLNIPGARLVEGLEADDLMGIMLTNGRYPEAVCVTIDKDLRTVPGRHLNPVSKTGVVPEVVVTTAEEGMRWWLTQALTGDKVDGYSGLPGTGPVKAEKILRGVPMGSLWDAVRGAFLAQGLTEEDALTQARVARILQAEDYDKVSKEILLWHPAAPVRIPLQLGITE